MKPVKKNKEEAWQAKEADKVKEEQADQPNLKRNRRRFTKPPWERWRVQPRDPRAAGAAYRERVRATRDVAKAKAHVPATYGRQQQWQAERQQRRMASMESLPKGSIIGLQGQKHGAEPRWNRSSTEPRTSHAECSRRPQQQQQQQKQQFSLSAETSFSKGRNGAHNDYGGRELHTVMLGPNNNGRTSDNRDNNRIGISQLRTNNGHNPHRVVGMIHKVDNNNNNNNNSNNLLKQPNNGPLSSSNKRSCL